jgi:hypothetical protein
MTAVDYRRSVEDIADSTGFANETYRLVGTWEKAGVGIEALEPILRFIEDHPDIDYGAPGPLVHFMETFAGNEYEASLLASLARKPTDATLWMLNRLINATSNSARRPALISAVTQAETHPLADEDARQSAQMFLDELEP